MPSENVRMVCAAAQQFNDADWASIEQLYGEESVMWALEGWPEAGPFHGPTEVIDQFKRLRDSFSENELSVLSVVGRGAWVVARYRWVVIGAGSGAPADAEFSAAFRFRAGRVMETHFHWQHGDALITAGLSPGRDAAVRPS